MSASGGELLPNEIQVEEDIGLKVGKPQRPVATDGSRQISTNGNRVNVRFNSDGVNVNNNWDDNRNSNIGLAVARNFRLPNWKEELSSI